MAESYKSLYPTLLHAYLLKPLACKNMRAVSTVTHMFHNGTGKYSTRHILKVLRLGAGKLAQWIRALTAFLKVLSSNPSNHMVAHNHP
jgi:hypothetical protein